jgi:hypothetical protein
MRKNEVLKTESPTVKVFMYNKNNVLDKKLQTGGEGVIAFDKYLIKIFGVRIWSVLSRCQTLFQIH